MYFAGQSAWTRFPDGKIFIVTGKQYLRGDGQRTSTLRACYLREEDFAAP